MNSRHFQGVLPDRVWLDGYLELLRRCDAVLVVERWESSSGSRNEIDEAIRQDIPIFYSLARLADWFSEVDVKSV
jgi:hypothetical protein